jgi:hypothetical protein
MKGDVMPLTGEVEVDETFIGGKAHNMHAHARKGAALTCLTALPQKKPELRESWLRDAA